MNIIYETTKERGATILMPTSMVDSMNLGRGAGPGWAANRNRTGEGAATRGLTPDDGSTPP